MNGRKKLLCVFLLVLFLFCYASINSFAVSSSTPQTSTPPAGDKNSSQAPKPNSTPETVSSTPAPPPSSKPAAAASSKPESKAAPSPSAAPSSKRAYRQTATFSASSADASSVVSSAITSSAPESGTISLPGVGSVAENDPLQSAAGDKGSSNHMKLIGMLSWACIGLGILVILIVVLSNHRPPRGPGRSRYHRTKRSNKKHLLNDKYYRGLDRY